MYEMWMRKAIEQARMSLRMGGDGEGVVVIREGVILAEAHDAGAAEHGVQAHAAMKALKAAAVEGRDLSSCILVATREPCPVCAEAIRKAGIGKIMSGCSDFEECRVLYDPVVRIEIDKLRNATDERLRQHNEESTRKRITWFRQSVRPDGLPGSDPLARAYHLLLERFGTTEDRMPIEYQDEKRIVFHSMNFCPTLEACRILGLDTRRICRLYNEGATDALVKEIDPGLRFSRNHRNLRPYAPYCEESIELTV